MTIPTVYYISGPMTGIPDFNAPAFNAMAARLRERGLSVCNPASFGQPAPGEPHLDWGHYLRKDIRAMMTHCNAVAVLPGWMDSRGAALECLVADELGWPIVEAEALAAGQIVPVRESFLPRYTLVKFMWELRALEQQKKAA